MQNLGNGYYQWNWNTPKSYAGSCKTVSLTLGLPGQPVKTADFSFKK